MKRPQRKRRKKITADRGSNNNNNNNNKTRVRVHLVFDLLRRKFIAKRITCTIYPSRRDGHRTCAHGCIRKYSSNVFLFLPLFKSICAFIWRPRLISVGCRSHASSPPPPPTATATVSTFYYQLYLRGVSGRCVSSVVSNLCAWLFFGCRLTAFCYIILSQNPFSNRFKLQSLRHSQCPKVFFGCQIISLMFDLPKHVHGHRPSSLAKSTAFFIDFLLCLQCGVRFSCRRRFSANTTAWRNIVTSWVSLTESTHSKT